MIETMLDTILLWVSYDPDQPDIPVPLPVMVQGALIGGVCLLIAWIIYKIKNDSALGGCLGIIGFVCILPAFYFVGQLLFSIGLVIFIIVLVIMGIIWLFRNL